jgi:hypothetical protein
VDVDGDGELDERMIYTFGNPAEKHAELIIAGDSIQVRNVVQNFANGKKIMGWQREDFESLLARVRGSRDTRETLHIPVRKKIYNFGSCFLFFDWEDVHIETPGSKGFVNLRNDSGNQIFEVARLVSAGAKTERGSSEFFVHSISAPLDPSADSSHSTQAKQRFEAKSSQGIKKIRTDDDFEKEAAARVNELPPVSEGGFWIKISETDAANIYGESDYLVAVTPTMKVSELKSIVEKDLNGGLPAPMQVMKFGGKDASHVSKEIIDDDFQLAEYNITPNLGACDTDEESAFFNKEIVGTTFVDALGSVFNNTELVSAELQESMTGATASYRKHVWHTLYVSTELDRLVAERQRLEDLIASKQPLEVELGMATQEQALKLVQVIHKKYNEMKRQLMEVKKMRDSAIKERRLLMRADKEFSVAEYNTVESLQRKVNQAENDLKRIKKNNKVVRLELEKNNFMLSSATKFLFDEVEDPDIGDKDTHHLVEKALGHGGVLIDN